MGEDGRRFCIGGYRQVFPPQKQARPNEHP